MEEATYRVSVETPETRIEMIKTRVESTANRYPFPHFQNRVQPLPVVTLPIALPLYRMANYRTRVEQLTYIRKHGKTNDFFSNGQENISAQQAQHDILFRFAQKGVGDSIIPIANVLQDSSQEEPILITSNGVVVNGNRRLSAMLELYIKGAQNYSHIDCMVLPEYATEEEIREIELKLQMTPQTLLPYDWACEGIAIKELLGSGMTKDQVCDLLRKKSTEVDNHILALDHADLYLNDRCGTPGDYSNADKQMFFDMARNLKNKEGDDLEVSRNIAFVLSDNSGDLGTRVYDYKGAFGAVSKEVATRLAKRLDIELTRVATDGQEDEFEFEIDQDESTDTFSLQPLIEVLKDKDRSIQLADEITDIYDNLKNEQDDRAAGQFALKRISEANTRLIEVDLTRADRSTYEAIREQLDSIQSRTAELKAQLERQSSIGAGA